MTALFLFASLALQSRSAERVQPAPFLAAQVTSHSADLTWQQPTQPAGETLASVTVLRNGASIATVTPATLEYLDLAVTPGTTYAYALTNTDTAGNSSTSVAVSATIPPNPAPLAISTVTLPAGTVGVAYSAQMAASGGTPPYAWSATGLAPLTISASGAISGMPAMAGMINATFTVTDSALNTSILAIPITVSAAPPPPPTTFTFGQTTSGASISTGDANFLNGSRYISASTGGTATICSAFVGSPISAAPNNKGECDVFADNSGKPGALIAHSTQVALVAGRNDFPISFPVAPLTAYWLMYNTNSSSKTSNGLRYANGNGSFGWMAAPFGTYPATLTLAGSTTALASIYVTYTTASTPPPVSVTVTPATASLTIGQTQQFVAAVKNATDTSVTWSTNAPSGLFAASASGTFTVTATSNADPTKSASATVTVAPPPLTWTCSGATCTAGGGTSGQKVPTQLNPPNGPTGTVTLP